MGEQALASLLQEAGYLLGEGEEALNMIRRLSV
jgi:hypothetical protein